MHIRRQENFTSEVFRTESCMSSGVSSTTLTPPKLTELSGVWFANFWALLGGDADCKRADLVAADTNIVDCLRDLGWVQNSQMKLREDNKYTLPSLIGGVQYECGGCTVFFGLWWTHCEIKLVLFLRYWVWKKLSIVKFCSQVLTRANRYGLVLQIWRYRQES